MPSLNRNLTCLQLNSILHQQSPLVSPWSYLFTCLFVHEDARAVHPSCIKLCFALLCFMRMDISTIRHVCKHSVRTFPQWCVHVHLSHPWCLHCTAISFSQLSASIFAGAEMPVQLAVCYNSMKSHTKA